MERLELRFYSRAEIADIIGVDTANQHFARKTKDTLAKWGYTFVYTRKGVTIEKIPETTEERIAEMAIRVLNLDVQVDAAAFGIFFYLLSTDGDFQCCPWNKRSEYIKDLYDITVAESTLRNWCAKLYNLNILHKDDDSLSRVLWLTVNIDGRKIQEPVEDEEDWKVYEYYCKTRKDLLDAEMAAHGDRKLAWRNVFAQLWKKFHCVYYYCKPIVFNGIMNEDTRKLLQLVEYYVEGLVYPEEEDEQPVRIEPLNYYGIKNENFSF